jgi:uncharacterized protein YndB with AHSA1/START domain
MSPRDSSLQTLVVERRLPHAPAKVWRALTQRALLEEWLMANDFQPVVGHRFHLRAPATPHWNGVVACEVLEVVPERRLVYTWSSTGDAPGAGLRTTVTWTLVQAGDGTDLRMEQSGFAADDTRNYQGAAYGWPKFIDALVRVCGAMA